MHHYTVYIAVFVNCKLCSIKQRDPVSLPEKVIQYC